MVFIIFPPSSILPKELLRKVRKGGRNWGSKTRKHALGVENQKEAYQRFYLVRISQRISLGSHPSPSDTEIKQDNFLKKKKNVNPLFGFSNIWLYLTVILWNKAVLINLKEMTKLCI